MIQTIITKGLIDKMMYKLIQKSDKDGCRIIDVEHEDLEELLSFYLKDNGSIDGILEVYQKTDKGSFDKIREIETGEVVRNNEHDKTK